MTKQESPGFSRGEQVNSAIPTSTTISPEAWESDALCRGDLEFCDRPIPDQLALCQQPCPVRLECLELGLSLRPKDKSSTVVFGGLPPFALVMIRRDRDRERRTA